MPPIAVGAPHVGDAAVGFVVITALPASSTATHNDNEAHETPLSEFVSMFIGALHLGVGPAGLVVTTACPASSTATHNDDEAHETPVSAFVPSMFVGALQAGCAAAGFVVITACPASSTATHNELEAHETPLRRCGLENGGWWSTNTGAAHESRYARAAPTATPSIATAKQAHTRHTNTVPRSTRHLIRHQPFLRLEPHAPESSHDHRRSQRGRPATL